MKSDQQPQEFVLHTDDRGRETWRLVNPSRTVYCVVRDRSTANNPAYLWFAITTNYSTASQLIGKPRPIEHAGNALSLLDAMNKGRQAFETLLEDENKEQPNSVASSA